MLSVKPFTQCSCSDEPSDMVYCLQFSKACFPMENIDITLPLILVFLFFLFIIFYKLVLSGNVVSGGNNVSLTKWLSEVAQSVQIFVTPMDCSLLGSSVHGIFQARVLEWVAISFSRGSSRPRDWTQVSCFAVRCFTIWATREAQGEKIKMLPFIKR